MNNWRTGLDNLKNILYLYITAYGESVGSLNFKASHV